MAGLTVVLHYRRTATYGLNVLLGAVEQELGVQPGLRLETASGIEAALAAATVAAERGDRVLVAWSFYSPELPAVAAELARFHAGFGRPTAGSAGAPVLHVAGGVHATAEPVATLELGFDLVVQGEGEAVFVELVRAMLDDPTLRQAAPLGAVPGVVVLDAEGRARRAEPSARHPLGRFPAFAVQRGRYNPIEITRGCIYGCTFCQTPYLFKARFRHRPVDDVAHHAGLLVDSGRRDVRFITPTALSYGSQDETVALDAVEELLAAVRRRIGPDKRLFFGTFPSEVRPEHVSAAALRLIRRWCDNDNVVIGGQSGSASVLDATNRGHGVDAIVEAVRLTREAGLVANVDLLFGLPGEGDADVEASLRLAEQLAGMGARVHGHTFMPLPGTPLRDAAAGSISDGALVRLERLSSSGALYGSWRRQRDVAAALVELRPTRRRRPSPLPTVPNGMAPEGGAAASEAAEAPPA